MYNHYRAKKPLQFAEARYCKMKCCTLNIGRISNFDNKFPTQGNVMVRVCTTQYICSVYFYMVNYQNKSKGEKVHLLTF